MADHRNNDSNRRPDVASPRALSTPPPPIPANEYTASEGLDPTALKILHNAALDASPNAAKQALQRVLAMGLDANDIYDFYIPTVARVLGDMWCSDTLSFAGVTIGVSRLQTMLRELGPNWSGDMPPVNGGNAILVIVPQEIYHTLGAIVLSGQLRRMGHSVKLLLGATAKEIALQALQTNYSAIFISSSRGESLESLRIIVDEVKNTAPTAPPIIIGGTILEVETVETVTALTGANHATQIPQEALDYCGLLKTPRVSAPAQPGI